jgi:branched-chain amino acid aminotransferase
MEDRIVKPKYTWMNGRVVPWEESTVHVSSDVVRTAASVFEGLRAYRSREGSDLMLFRADDHMKRLFNVSMRVMRMQIEYGPAQLIEGVKDLLRASDAREDTHIRVCAYFDDVEYGKELEATTGVYILAYPRGHNARMTTGLRATISQWRHIPESALTPRVKASANYLNGRLANVDAKLKGFDTPVMLNEFGKVSEGSGANIFIVRDGVLITPRVTDGILNGLTRDTVIRIANDLSIPLEEREVDPTELYVADEAFLTGTSMEVLPIVEVDLYSMLHGAPGPITRKLQDAYDEIVRGVTAPRAWITHVYGKPEPVGVMSAAE